MTHTNTELLSCPFCGGRAEFDDHDADCYFTKLRAVKQSKDAADMAPIMELLPAWNRRTPASQAQRVPLALYQRDTIKANAWRETRDGGHWDVNAIIDGTERAHGITQEKQG